MGFRVLELDVVLCVGLAFDTDHQRAILGDRIHDPSQADVGGNKTGTPKSYQKPPSVSDHIDIELVLGMCDRLAFRIAGVRHVICDFVLVIGTSGRIYRDRVHVQHTGHP